MKVAALCAGYGGLELGLDVAGFECQLEWFAENDRYADAVMRHNFGDVDNLGDLTTIEDPPPVDLVTAGFPCQPVSAAGRRKGIHDERWLIHDVVGLARRAGARWLFLENVSGVYGANDGEAFGQILDALSEGGFDAEWTSLRASDVGSCHRRERWFCLAHSSSFGRDEGTGPSSGGTDRLGRTRPRDDGRETPPVLAAESRIDGRLFPTPTARDWKGRNQRDDDTCLPGAVERLLPTPAASQPNDGESPEQWRERYDRHANRTDQEPTRAGVPLPIVLRTLPTPTAMDSRASGSGVNSDPKNGNLTLTDVTVRNLIDWDVYAEAIDRHEQHVAGRPPPEPIDGKRLNVRFVEWMMGLPEGWVTDVPDLSRSQQLTRLGNGVVPLQAGTALAGLAERFDN